MLLYITIKINKPCQLSGSSVINLIWQKYKFFTSLTFSCNFIPLLHIMAFEHESISTCCELSPIITLDAISFHFVRLHFTDDSLASSCALSFQVCLFAHRRSFSYEQPCSAIHSYATSCCTSIHRLLSYTNI